MAYSIQRQEDTGLWIVLFSGLNLRTVPTGILGRGALPSIAINFAAERVDEINDPVTGIGAGTIPPLTPAVKQQLLRQASLIEQQERARFARESTAEVVAEGQTARAEGASVTNPPPPEQTLDANEQIVDIRDLPPTNAERPPETAPQDTGTNDRLRRATETQSTPPNTASPGGLEPAPRGPQPSAAPGPAAAGDDVRASINAIFGGERARIITQDNQLDKYASYSYSISIYLMSPTDYARLIRTKQKNLAGYNLLIQSAGIPLSTGFGSTPGFVGGDTGEVPGATTRSLDAGRNEYFQEDFYIDDLRIKSVISGKGTAGPHNVVSMEFRIIEPNGITLLPRLFKATQAYVASQVGTGTQNYAAQNFLMVIRFYGYDVNGNQYVPIKGARNDDKGNPETTPQVIEKFIPFQFTAVKFRVADRLTEYQCEAVSTPNLINTGPARGVIPYNVEITSKTLKELLSGPVAFNSPARAGAVTPAAQVTPATPGLGNTWDLEQGITPDPDIAPVSTAAPAKASAISTPTITQGLAEALNQYQLDLVARKIYEVPDKYFIEIVTPALQNSKVMPPGQTNQRTVPMGPGSKAPANQQKNPATQSQNKDAKNTSALAGMSIMQFIDQYTRTSTYIYAQQTKIRDPKTQGEVINGTPAEVTAWYRVGLQAVPRISAGYDRKRNDYAYEITYQLSPYKVNDVQSDYFPQAKFNGAHKKYNYWFTGENTQILRFEQDFNYLYYLTVNTEQPTVATGFTTDYREYLKKSFSPRSAQSSMGQQGPTNEPSANAADYLYSPADQGRVKIEIVGDPAWIQQGELWAGIAGAGQAFGPFLDDGTINYEGQEALFEIAFNLPVDYNLDTGVMDPTTNNYNKTSTSAGSARQSYVYRATDVTSTFSQGRFTQELNGVLILFDLPKTNASAVLPVENESSAETRRLLAAANRGSTGTARITAALGDTPGVEFAGSEFGAYFGTGDTGGAVNYKPTGLAQVLDRQRPQLPVTADSLGAEGFSDPTAVSDVPAPTAPTSGGQVIGPAASGTAAVATQGGASGRGVGQPPSVVATLTNGSSIIVINQQQINDLVSGGLLSPQQAARATQQLARAQQAANSPVTNRAPQQIAREP